MSRLLKTHAIVLNYIKYKETSVIVRLFTEELGVLSVIVNGVRSAKSKKSIALFQPLTMLDVVIYFNEQKELHRLNEVRCSDPIKTLNTDIRKIAIVIFLDEIIYESLKQGAPDREIFEFIRSSLLILDLQEEHISHFHLQFLLKFAHFLGFGTNDAFQIIQIVRKHFHQDERVNQSLSALQNVINSNYGEKLSLNRLHKMQLLKIILQFYTYHFPKIGDIKSLAVLNSTFG